MPGPTDESSAVRWRWLWACGGVLAACAAEPEGDALHADGAACEWSAECRSGLCVPERSGAGETGWTGGMCVSVCDGGGACGGGGVCVRFDAEALCVPACDSPAGCREGYVCGDGACVPDCRRGFACGAQRVCDLEDGRCRLPVSPGASFGQGCAEDGECGSLVCLEAVDEAGEATGWVGGLCSASCAGEAACPEGGVCIRLGEHLLCVLGCETAGGCEAGYVCHPEAGACLPDCRLGWECAAGFACDEGSGACVIEVVVPAEVGAPCEVAADCASGICVPSEDVDGATGRTDGMCIAPCGSVLCGEATGCAILDGASWCLPACASGDEQCNASGLCRSGGPGGR